MSEERELRVVYRDNERTRVIRGVLIGEDDHFIEIARKTGTIRLNKAIVERIEDWNSGGMR